MKKVLATGVALLMAGSIATAAEMEDKSGIRISGDARARLVYKNAYDFGNESFSAPESEFDQTSRVRFQLQGTAAGGAYAIGRLRMLDGSWNGTNASGEKSNLFVDKAYIGIPFTDEFTMEAGQYYQSVGNKFFYYDKLVRGFKGVYRTDGDSMVIVPFFENFANGQSSDNAVDQKEDNDQYNIGLWGQFKVAEGWKIGAYGAFVTDDQEGSEEDGFYGTAWFSGAVGGFGLMGELAYAEEGTKFTAGDEDSGYGGFIAGSYTMDALTMALHLGFTKDGFESDDDYGFIMLGGGADIMVYNFGEGGFDTFWAGLVVDYAVSEKLSLNGNIVYLDADGNDVVGTDESRLFDFVEVSGGLSYAISKGATFNWIAGYAAPSFDGRATAAGVEEDGAFGTRFEFTISF